MQADWQLGATRLTQHFRSLQSRREQLEVELATSGSSQAHQAEGAVQAVSLQRMKELWASLQVSLHAKQDFCNLLHRQCCCRG